ncbi:MAG: DinB family protein [Phycisphaerae bacterium]
MKTKRDGEVALLLRMLDEGFGGAAWHGPTLRGAVRGIKARQAVWRPGPKRHCIAEIAVHCAYWKYAARRRMTGEKRGSFAMKGSNWFGLPAKLTDATWREYTTLLDTTHAALCETAASLSPRQLRTVPKGAKIDNARLLFGMALHDVYHAGQVRLIKSLMGGKR